MPLGKRRPDEEPRQEYFEDNTGAITLEIGFDLVHGFFMGEVFNFDQRRTRGQDTAILIEKISRPRIAELYRKIVEALAKDNEKHGVSLTTVVDSLLYDLRLKIDAFVDDPVNLDESVEAKSSFVLIARAVDEHRAEALQRQRHVVLSVLLDDQQLKRPRTFA